MNIARVPMLDKGGLPALIKDYLKDAAVLKPFYGIKPETQQMTALAQSRVVSPQMRQLLSRRLQEQNAGRSALLLDRIKSLQESNVFTVTTGHQVCIAGGPLFFIYKIASAIKLARMLNQATKEFRFLPVFWMATEDHDFEEIQSIQLFGKTITWHTSQTGAVGRFHLNEINAFLEELNGIAGNDERILAALRKLSKVYSAKNLAEATRELAYVLFGEEELIVIDADDAALKQAFVPIMEREIIDKQSFQLVKETSEQLEALGYKSQVHPREINLFHLIDGKRERIRFEEKYILASGECDEAALLNELNQFPERFSPNVILRPVYQEHILPNVAYIGGPGELSYWLQLKNVFSLYSVSFPALVLRDSALILTSGIRKKMEKLGLNNEDLFLKQDQIIQRWVAEANVHDLTRYRTQLSRLFEEIAQILKNVDPTLESSALAEGKKVDVGVEHLEKKMVKHIKQKEETRIQQLEKIFSESMPNGSPQERLVNWLQFTEVFTKDGMALVIDAFNPLQPEIKIIG